MTGGIKKHTQTDVLKLCVVLLENGSIPPVSPATAAVPASRVSTPNENINDGSDDRWVEKFSIPWEKMPNGIMKVLGQNKQLSANDRNRMDKIVVEAAKSYVTTWTRLRKWHDEWLELSQACWRITRMMVSALVMVSLVMVFTH